MNTPLPWTAFRQIASNAVRRLFRRPGAVESIPTLASPSRTAAPVPAWFVATVVPLAYDDVAVFPVSVLYVIRAQAERRQRQLSRAMPSCVVLEVTLAADSASSSECAVLERYRRQALAETIGGS